MTDFDRPVHDPAAGPDPDIDTTATPVPTIPIGAPPLDGTAVAVAPAQRSNRLRWIAAAAVVALVVGVSAIAAFALTGSSPAADVLGYVPDDSVMYGEVRLDLPGDQRQEVGEFLAKFPGFADQAALDTKLDEVLDRFLSESTDGKQTFTRDIKPWFDGELAFAMGPLPSAAALQQPEQLATSTRFLVLISIKDDAAAKAWFATAMAEANVTGTPQTHEGTDLTVFADPNSDVEGALAFIDAKVAVFGDTTSVKAAIDTNGTSGLAASDAFKAAQAAISGDHIGFFFVDARALVDAAMGLTEVSGSTPPISDAMIAMIPDWTAMRLRVEGDALVMDAMAPHVDAAPGPDGNHANAVAGYAPPSTIVLAAGNDLGPALVEMIGIYRQDPSLADAFKQVDQIAGMLGGLDSGLAWMGDTGVVIARTGDTLEGGLVSIPTDAAAGKQLLTTLRSFVQLGGGQMGIDVRDVDHNGTTITVIDLGSLEDLAGMAGALGGVPLEGGSISGLPEGNVEIAYAATDGVVVIGSSPAFVEHVLDAGAGESLADGARFKGLVDRVGAQHTGVTFVDITAIRDLVESAMTDASPEEMAEYEESVKPFLTPFDALVGVGVTSDDLEAQHIVVTVH